MFSEAIDLLVSLQRAERLPHFIDDKTKNYVNFKQVRDSFNNFYELNLSKNGFYLSLI